MLNHKEFRRQKFKTMFFRGKKQNFRKLLDLSRKWFLQPMFFLFRGRGGGCQLNFVLYHKKCFFLKWGTPSYIDKVIWEMTKVILQVYQCNWFPLWYDSILWLCWMYVYWTYSGLLCSSSCQTCLARGYNLLYTQQFLPNRAIK